MEIDINFVIKFRRAFLQTRYMNKFEGKVMGGMGKIEPTELTEEDVEEHLKIIDGLSAVPLSVYELSELSERFCDMFGGK